MAALKGVTDLQKLKSLCKKTYSEQAKWFLNAWWSNAPLKIGATESKVEQIWTFCKAMEKLDSARSAGSSLEQFTAHRFLEKNTEALTWTTLKKSLVKLNIDFSKNISLTVFLIHHFNVDWKQLVNSTQSCSKEAAVAIKRAEEAVTEAQAKQAACVVKLHEAGEAQEAAVKAEEEAKNAHDAEVVAEREVKAILARIQGFENALAKKAAALQAIIDDPSSGMVKKMKAKHELMDLKNGSRARRKGISECNPELLRKAKIDQKAAVRKQKRATANARETASIAKEARLQAEETTSEAERAVQESQDAMERAVQRVAEVRDSVKGAGEGTVWWMGRELKEQQKYLPKAAFARLKRKHKKKVEAMKP